MKATLPSVLDYALGKVAKFFLFLFSLFFDINTTNIYINAGVITGVITINI